MRAGQSGGMRAAEPNAMDVFLLSREQSIAGGLTHENLSRRQFRQNLQAFLELLLGLADHNGRIRGQRVAVHCRHENRLGGRIRVRYSTEGPGCQRRPQPTG